MASLQGQIEIPAQDLYTSSATQLGNLGQLATTGDGRYFRYVVGSGTALVAGRVYQAWPQDTTNFQNLAISAAGTGTAIVSTTTTITVLANQLAGGTLSVRSGQGAGYQYTIKSHAAASAGTVALNLQENLVIGLNTASRIDVTPSSYNSVIQTAAPPTSSVLGVAVTATPASQYGWLQTRGPCPVYCEVITVGRAVSYSVGTAGAVGPATGTQAVLGYAMTTTIDQTYMPVFLTID